MSTDNSHQSCTTEPLPISIMESAAGSVAGLASRMLIHDCPTDPRPPPARIRSDLPPEEDRLALLRRQPLRQLRQGPRHPRLPDRGAEDCQEGHARSREEEQEVDVGLLRRRSDGMIMASDLASRKRHSTTLLCEQSFSKAADCC